jgi:hypothetical protein
MMESGEKLVDLLQQHQDAVLLCAMAGMIVVVGAILCRRLGDPSGDDPKVMLRHIRWEIRSARDEFSKYPATRQIQEIVDGLGDCETTIDQVMTKL